MSEVKIVCFRMSKLYAFACQNYMLWQVNFSCFRAAKFVFVGGRNGDHKLIGQVIGHCHMLFCVLFQWLNSEVQFTPLCRPLIHTVCTAPKTQTSLQKIKTIFLSLHSRRRAQVPLTSTCSQQLYNDVNIWFKFAWYNLHSSSYIACKMD